MRQRKIIMERRRTQMTKYTNSRKRIADLVSQVKHFKK